MGINEIIILANQIKTLFFRLNEEQRRKLSDFCDKAATGAMLPVAIKFLSDGKPGDGWYIFLWLMSALSFVVLSVLALATKGEENDR